MFNNSMETITTEKTFFQDANVTVTQSRFISQSKTYAMSNISSVSIFRKARNKFFDIALIIIGAVCLFSGGARVVGFVMVLIGVLMLFLLKDTFSVRIQSNSGEADGFMSKDHDLILKIVNAVNDAIVHRG